MRGKDVKCVDVQKLQMVASGPFKKPMILICVAYTGDYCGLTSVD
jgi:hypothetical protein